MAPRNRCVAPNDKRHITVMYLGYRIFSLFQMDSALMNKCPEYICLTRLGLDTGKCPIKFGIPGEYASLNPWLRT